MPRAALGVVLLVIVAALFYLLSSVTDVGGDLLYERQIGSVYVGDLYYIGAIAVAAVAILLRVELFCSRVLTGAETPQPRR